MNPRQKVRHGYTDFAIPLSLLRKALAEKLRGSAKTQSREEQVRTGVEILRTGLFKMYADEFMGYIASNALNMVEGDLRANGIEPRTGVTIQPRKQSKRIIRKRDAALMEVIEKRVLIKLAADMTHAEAHRLGGAFQNMFKRGSKEKIWDTHSAQLEKLGCQKT